MTSNLLLRALLTSALLVTAMATEAVAASVPRKSPEFAVRLTPSGQKLLSSYRGKVVLLVFLSTTCPHCQQLTPVLSRFQAQYGPQGFQVLGVAFNDMANMLVPDFVRQYRPGFPLGWAPREAVLEYLQHSPMMQLYVPSLVFVDRNGTIQGQYLGDDPFHQKETENIKAKVESLLKGSARSSKGSRHSKSS